LAFEDASEGILMTDNILHKLQERIKELTALHAAARILQDDSQTPEEIVKRITWLLPPAWQYPEITVARIIFDDINCSTSGFRESRWNQKAHFSTKTDRSGSIEIYYLEERPESDEGPFLGEERDLIESLADMLGSYFQRRQADLELRQTLDNLEAQVQARTRELSDVNIALREQVSACQNAQRHIESYQEKLRQLTSELSLAEARERREIAEDLHDHIGQALAYIKMNISVLRGNAIFCGFESNIENLMKLLDQTIKYTRDLTFEISPPVLYELGLFSTLEWLAERFREKHAITITIRKFSEIREIDDDCRITVFKSVQELLMNAVKHSGATKIVIDYECNAEHLSVRVADDGCGFEVGILDSTSSSTNRFGLFNIRERLSYLGGEARIESEIGAGTTIILNIPFGKGAKDGNPRNPGR
jgi:signal transduction histidine kinase